MGAPYVGNKSSHKTCFCKSESQGCWLANRRNRLARAPIREDDPVDICSLMPQRPQLGVNSPTGSLFNNYWWRISTWSQTL
jgi:hypothetical protein